MFPEPGPRAREAPDFSVGRVLHPGKSGRFSRSGPMSRHFRITVDVVLTDGEDEEDVAALAEVIEQLPGARNLAAVVSDPQQV